VPRYQTLLRTILVAWDTIQKPARRTANSATNSKSCLLRSESQAAVKPAGKAAGQPATPPLSYRESDQF
jgi:hypothetical protein